MDLKAKKQHTEKDVRDLKKELLTTFNEFC